MQFYLKSLGCRLNEAETQRWSQQFLDAGYRLTTKVEDADLMVLNSCAVTAEAARKSRQQFRRLHRKNPTAKMVATGCYASLEEAEVASILGVDLVIKNSKKDQLVDIVREHFDLNDAMPQTMPSFATEPGESALFIRNRDRAFIKIQDGCRYRCSYCIVTVARGIEKSRSISDIIQEVNLYVQQGIQEIVLTGVHVGGYGSDLGSNLYQLVQTLLDDTDIPRIRFASVEPWDLPETFFNLFENKRLMPHMHLPIQSGSDTVLRRMSRRSNQQSFKRLIEGARKSIPDFNVTTDVIVGFPGETEDEWQQTLDFVQEIGFGHIHVFSYSHRDGTRASKLKDLVSSTIKKQRCQAIAQIAQQLKHDEYAKMLGQKVDVLWESGKVEVGNNRYRFSGYTPNYHRITAKISVDAAGLILPTTVHDIAPDSRSLVGAIAEDEQAKLGTLISVKQV